MAETPPYEIAYKGNIYKIVQEKAYSMQGADKHNAILKANVYYQLSARQINDISNGSFASLYIGDRFVINNHGYTVAAFNYKKNHEQNLDLPNHVLLLSDIIGRYAMGDASQGWGNTDVFKNIFPNTIVPQLKTDWGSHLLTFKSFVSTGLDANGAPNRGEWRSLQANMCNAMMFLGDVSHSNNKNGNKYNIGDEDTQLPLTKLKPSERSSNGSSTWLRDVYDSSGFALAYRDGSALWLGASYSAGVRAYFLIS